MKRWEDTNNWITLLSYVTLFTLFIFSIVFYKERTIHTDNAFQHFLMIKEGFPQIMVHRYGMMLIKFPSYLTLLLTSSIRASLLVFSMSYLLIYGAVFFLLEKIIQNRTFALLIPIFLTTMFAYDFYWCASEQITGIVIMLLVFGMLKPDFNKRFYWIFGISLILLLNFFHPLVVLPVTFLLIYMSLEHKKLIYLSWFVFIILGLVTKNLFFTAAYDAERFSTFTLTLSKSLGTFWNIQSFQDFFQMCWKLYPFFYIFFLLSAFFLLYSKSFLKIIIWILWMFIHLLIISINEPIINFPYYAESNFLIFSVYTALPFLLEIKKYTLQKLAFILLLICFSTSIVRIFRFHKSFSDRVNYLEDLVLNMNSSKAYLNWENTNQEILITEWAVPFETALLSSFNNENITKTIYIPRDPKKFMNELTHIDEFISVLKIIKLSELNNKWIKIPYEPYVELAH